LADLLAREPDVEIVGVVADGMAALRLLWRLAVDLVFLDAHLTGLGAFEVLRLIPEQPLIVLTATNGEFALAAFKENAVDYLLRPVRSTDVKHALRKVRAMLQHRPAARESIPSVNPRVPVDHPAPRQLLVSTRDVLRPSPLDQIICLEARDKRTLIYTSQVGHETDSALGNLEARLPSSDFVRIHRRHIVNIRYIKELQRWGSRRYRVELTTPIPAELCISRRCVAEVLERLGGHSPPPGLRTPSGDPLSGRLRSPRDQFDGVGRGAADA
jgi:DNA-binding LytR/AlgR family response regulator